MLRNLLLPITAHSLDAPEALPTPHHLTPTIPPPFTTSRNGHISSSLGQAGVRGDVQKQLGSVHTGFNLAELESGLRRGPTPTATPHPSPLPHHTLVLQMALMLTMMDELQ